MTSSVGKSARTDAVLVLILLLGFAVRIPELGTAGLWNDEAIVAAVAERPFSELIEEVRADAHPPLFFVVQRLVRVVVGFDNWSEATIRAAPLVFGMISILLIYFVGKNLISRSAGLTAALLLALNHMHVHYSREARNYSLVIMLVLLAIACVAAMQRNPTTRSGALTAIIFVALIYTHSISFFVLAPLGLMLLTPLFESASKERVQALGVCAFVGVLGLIPWLPTLMEQVFQVSNTSVSGSGPVEWVKPHFEKMFPYQIPSSLAAFTHGSPPPINNAVYQLDRVSWSALGLSILLIFSGLRSRSHWKQPWSANLLLSTCLLPLILLFAYSLIGTPIYSNGRVDSIALPAFILLLASSACALGSGGVKDGLQNWRVVLSKQPIRKSIWFSSMATLVLISAHPIRDEIQNMSGTENREWVSYFARYMADGDVLVVTAKWWMIFEYYLPRNGKEIHLLGFPSAREDHPNWLDVTVYDGDSLNLDAKAVASKAAGISLANDSITWVFPDYFKFGVINLIAALDTRMQAVQFKNHPSWHGQSYKAYHAKGTTPRAEVMHLTMMAEADSNPGSADMQYEAARALQKLGDHAQAIKYLERASSIEPWHRSAGFWLGFAFQMTGDSSKSIEAYEQFVSLKPRHYQAQFNLAYELKSEGDCPSAIERFLTVLELQPGNLVPHLHLSNCYRVLGDEARAIIHKSIYERG